MRAALQSDGERGQGNLQIANCTTVIHRQWVALLGERLKKIFCLTNKAVARQVGQVIPSTKGKTLVPFWSRCRQYVWVSLKKAFIRFIKYIYYISQITIRHFQKCVYPLFPLRFFFGKLIFRQAGREGYPLSRKNPLSSFWRRPYWQQNISALGTRTLAGFDYIRDPKEHWFNVITS